MTAGAPIPTLLAILDPLDYPLATADWCAAAQGVRGLAVWVRDRHRHDRERLTALQQLVHAGLTVVASDRADLCCAAAAEGVHLSRHGLPANLIRGLLPDGSLIGRSTHSLAEIRRAADEGADYAVFGPVWPTPGKGEAVGVGELELACQVGIPVLALGGVSSARVPQAAAAGAHGVAGIRCCATSQGLGAMVAAVRSSWPI